MAEVRTGTSKTHGAPAPGGDAGAASAVPAWETVALVVLWCAVQAVALQHPDLGTVDPEEGMGPALAVVAEAAGPGALLTYQVDPLTGGPNVMAVIERPLFALFGSWTWVHKLALLGFGATMVAAVHRALALRVDRVAARAWALACLFPSGLAADLAVRRWTNHYEGSALALAAGAIGLAARSTPWAVVGGLLAGLAVYLGPIAITLLVVVGVGLVATQPARRWGAFAAAAGWPVIPWTALYLREGRSVLDLAGRTAWTQGSDVAFWDRLDPVLGATAWHAPRGTAGFALVALGLAAVGLWRARDRRGALVLAAPVAWLGFYLLGPAQLGPLVYPSYFHHRYAVPVALVAPVALALGASAWARVGAPRMAALTVALGVVPGVVHVASRPLDDGTGAGSAASRAPAWAWFLKQGLLLPSETQQPLACAADDARCLGLEAYRRGVAAARRDAVTTHGFSSPTDAADEAMWWLGYGAAIGALDATHVLAARRGVPAGAVAAARATAPRAPVCGEGPLAGWAMAQRLAPRWRMRRLAPPCDDDATAIGWAYGMGQLVAARWGEETVAPGAEDWPATVRAAFEDGVASLEHGAWRLVPARPLRVVDGLSRAGSDPVEGGHPKEW